MKKIGLMVLLFLLLCGCTSEQAAKSPNVTPNTEKKLEETSKIEESAKEPEYIVKTLNSFHVEQIYDMFDFMKNPRQNNLYYCLQDTFRFVKREGQLVLKDMRHGDDPTFFDVDGDDIFAREFNSGEYCSRAVAFLCDEDAIKQRFSDHGIDGIRDIVIIDFLDEKVGYIIAAVTEKEAYYMTVPLAAEVYGDYIFQKIYTSKEFKNVYGPHPAKVFINEKEVKFSSKTLLGENYLEMDILDFLNALGVKYKYNEKSKEITTGDYTIRFKYNESSPIVSEYEEFIKSAKVYHIYLTTPEFANEPCGMAKYRNGRYLGSKLFFQDPDLFLGYRIEYHYDDYSVHIYKDKGQSSGNVKTKNYVS